MTKEQMIDFANRTIYGNWHPTSEESMKLVEDYINEIDSSKINMIQIYAQFPDEIKVNVISHIIKYYVEKYQINTLLKVIQTPFGEQIQLIKYL